ncbi:hypothetical protein CLM71_08645 [Serratia sp. MYb239]|uniref:DUF968 domain-containing protein n=1 Tax=Serratia sp. MYb239 TaxID=2033438 RepID=UPI000CF7368B|nr:DUF968 domain-containing protein [Serratia sp. MYb239]AVJ17194.1 hypothetical protein CLM71_08645 [Serratia sp. MYb239]
MRALLKSITVPELGQIILRPGKELLPHLTGRLLVCREPSEFAKLPSGALPAPGQELANDPRFTPFYQHERVLIAAGGINSLEHWVSLKRSCQIEGDHTRHMTTLRYDNSAIRLCEGCDNRLRGQSIEKLQIVADANRAAYILETVRSHFLLDQGHQVTMPELCWWAVMRGVADLLPDDVCSASLRLPPAKIHTGGRKESEITHTPAARQVVAEKVNKAAKTLVIDPEPPKSFMKFPKRERWESKPYLKWVKSQPCAACGGTADDPHHIIGHGQGGMATKAHDLFTIPLCRKHHDYLHRDMSRFEEEYGSQIELWFKFMDWSLSVGSIK